MKSRCEKLYCILPYLVLLGALLFSVGMYAYLGAHNLDSDRSSEMILANLLNEEGGFLSPSWYYSTELRVVSPVPVYQLGLRLFDSWHAARTFAIAVLLMGIAASFIFMMRGVGIGDAAVYCAACMILPISWLSMFMLTYGQFYSVYFILICVVIGLLVRIKRSKTYTTVGTVLLVLLSVWGGMQGVRMLMLCAAPLALAVCAMLYAHWRECRSVHELLYANETAYALGAMLICTCMFVGYLINDSVLSKLYTYKSFSATLMYKLNWEEVAKQINYLPEYFGFVNGVTFISFDGLINVISIAAVALAVFSASSLAFRAKTFSAGERLYIWFTIFSVLLGIAINSMTIYGNSSGIGSVSYYLPGLLLLISAVFVYVEKSNIRMRSVRAIVLLVITGVFALNSVHYIRRNMRVADADYEVTADWLVENGYKNGFTTFWNANILTEASDGYLEIYTLNKWEDMQLSPWLQKKEHLEKLPEGKVFVFVPRTEVEISPVAKEDHIVYQAPHGWVYEYSSAQEVVGIYQNAAQ